MHFVDDQEVCCIKGNFHWKGGEGVNIENLKKLESIFRKMTPKELADNFRDAVEHLETDDRNEEFHALNLLRAADILDHMGDKPFAPFVPMEPATNPKGPGLLTSVPVSCPQALMPSITNYLCLFPEAKVEVSIRDTRDGREFLLIANGREADT